MSKPDRFQIKADVELNICLWCRVCRMEFWSTGAYVGLSEIKAAIAEHKAECKEQNATKNKGTGTAGQDPYPLNLC